MKITRKFILSFIISIFCLFGMNRFKQVVLAEGAEFTVTPIYSDGQSDKSLGYFSILSENNQIYPITVNIQNLSKKDRNRFSVQLVAASTSDSGTIDYTPNARPNIKNDDPLLPDLVSKQESKKVVNINPESSKEVSFALKIPKNGFAGTILGSIYIHRETDNAADKKGFGVNNTFAMTIPVVISATTINSKIPELSLQSVKVQSNSGVPQIVGEIANSSAIMFGKIKIKAWITKRDNKQKIYQRAVDNFEMAPRSTLNYAIDTKQQFLSKGEYTYHAEMISGKRTFKFTKNFKVDRKTKEKINRNSVQIEPQKVNWILLGVLVLLAVITVGISAYLLGKKKIE